MPLLFRFGHFLEARAKIRKLLHWFFGGILRFSDLSDHGFQTKGELSHLWIDPSAKESVLDLSNEVITLKLAYAGEKTFFVSSDAVFASRFQRQNIPV